MLRFDFLDAGEAGVERFGEGADELALRCLRNRMKS